MNRGTASRTHAVGSLWLLAGLTASAFAADTGLKVGATALAVPAPAGFRDATPLPHMRQLFETMTPAMNRLLAVYLEDADFAKAEKMEPPSLRRYMMVQAQRDAEGVNMSPEQFAAAAQELKGTQQKLIEQSKANVDQLFQEASGKLSQQTGTPIELNAGEQLPLGVFLETPDALGSAVLAKLRIAVADKPTDYLMVTGINLVRAREKVLFAYVYSGYQDEGDVAWVKKTSTEWAARILKANPVATADPAAVTQRAVENVTAAVVAALLLALALWAYRRRSRN